MEDWKCILNVSDSRTLNPDYNEVNQDGPEVYIW